MFEKGQKIEFLGVEAVVIQVGSDFVRMVYVDALGKIRLVSFTKSDLEALI
jgi:hypothetical protein